MHACIAHTSIRGVEFVERGTQVERAGKWDKRVMYYDIIGVCRTMSIKEVRRALNFAMTTWDIEIDIEFRPIWFGNQLHKADIRIDFRNKSEYKLFKDQPSVLAVAYYPEQGEISGLLIFNDDYIFSLNGKSITGKKAKEKGWVDLGINDDVNIKTFNIIILLMHELGHMLGLNHDTHGDTEDVMDAFYNSKMISLSDWDIYRILLKYNRRIWRWGLYGRFKRWLRRRKQRF